MGNVGVSHDEAVFTHDCTAFGACTAVDGSAFANGGIVTYLGGGLFSGKLQVLRDAGYDSSGEDFASVAYARTVKDDGMGENAAIVADYNVFFHHHKRVYRYVSTDFRFRMDTCQGGYIHYGFHIALLVLPAVYARL
jgi:hypothetical protein